LVQCPGGRHGSLINTLDYEYDLGNQLTGTSDSNSQYAFTYDDLGRVLTVSNSGTSGVPTVVLTSAYDASSNRTSISSTIGGTADYKNDYTFDGLNRMTRVDQQSNGGNSVAEKRIDFSYNSLGQFTSIARYKDIDGGSTNEVVTSSFSYDTLDRLTDLAHKKGGSNLFTPYSWTFDYLSRVTGVTSQDGTASYTYDITSQLTATDFSYQTDESLSYEANGNRTMSGYSTGTNNQLTADGTYTYEYDNEGNRTKRTKNSDSSYTVYTWDFRNRLTNVTNKNSSNTVLSTVDYLYDTFDRRIKKSYDADGPGSGSAVVTRYAYDGDDIALQFDGSNNLTHRYLHGAVVDQILAEEQIGGTLLWPLTDDLGTVRDLVNSSGTVQNHLKYDSFGKVTAESNSAVDHLFAFTGRERDEETGLQYHRARYLDTSVGRWVSEDLIGFAAGDTNISRYVANYVTGWIDSMGLDWMPKILQDYWYYSWNRSEMDSGLQLVDNFAQGAVVGAAGGIVIVVGAPVVAGGLVAAGVGAGTATTVVNTGIVAAGVCGTAGVAVDTSNAVADGDWNRVAFNAGVLTTAAAGARRGGAGGRSQRPVPRVTTNRQTGLTFQQ
jgi:RHS repeat-associated protein